jgi:hypothetical protein
MNPPQMIQSQTDEQAEATKRYMAEETRLRWVKSFGESCPEEFKRPISRSLLKNPSAFDKLGSWDWSFPGFCCTGGTNCGKTRAVWNSIKRKVDSGTGGFIYFTARGLVEEYLKFHMDGEPKAFWKELGWRGWSNWDSKMVYPSLIFVDDLDKVDMNDRNCGVLFELFDRVYRDHIPCVSTTNKDRAWWIGKMGEAFVRRFMDDAQKELKF